MYRGRGLILNAYVRTVPVVKADVSADDTARPVHVAKQSLTVDTRCLNDAVDPSRHGIVRRLMVFRNADGDVMLPEHLHIDITAVLYAAVGMVDQSLRLVLSFIATAWSMAYSRACMVMAARKEPVRTHPIIVCE